MVSSHALNVVPCHDDIPKQSIDAVARKRQGRGSNNLVVCSFVTYIVRIPTTVLVGGRNPRFLDGLRL